MTAADKLAIIELLYRYAHGWYFTARRVDVEMIGDASAHLMVDPRQVRLVVRRPP